LRYRTWTLQAAKNLFPGSCTQFNTVKAAWDAVSVPAQPSDPTCGATSGNPFSYVNLRDEQLACFGISVAPNFPSNCRDITDFNDQQMCFGVSSRSQDPCRNITDRNLQLACFGISVAPNFPSNCRDITDSDMRNFCFGVASGGAMSNCNLVNDSNTRALCFAMATHNSSTCSSITASADLLFCQAVATRSQTPCLSIH
jgi:hypothetical protein